MKYSETVQCRICGNSNLVKVLRNTLSAEQFEQYEKSAAAAP